MSLINNNINQNIKQQVQVPLKSKKNDTTTKASNTAQASEALKSTTKLSSTEIQKGIANGSMTASKAINALQSDLNAKVISTKSDSVTTVQTSVSGKLITVITNAGDVPVLDNSSTIPTAKTIQPTIITDKTVITNDFKKPSIDFSDTRQVIENITDKPFVTNGPTIVIDPETPTVNNGTTNVTEPEEPTVNNGTTNGTEPEEPSVNNELTNVTEPEDPSVNNGTTNVTEPEDPSVNNEPTNVTEPEDPSVNNGTTNGTETENPPVNNETTSGTYSIDNLSAYGASTSLIAQFFDIEEINGTKVYTLKEGLTFDNFLEARIAENQTNIRNTVDSIYEKLSNNTSDWIALQMSFVAGEYISHVQYDESTEELLLSELSKQEGILSPEEVNAALEFLITTLGDSYENYSEAEILKLLVEFNKNGGVEQLNNLAAANLNNIGNSLKAVGEYLQQGDSDCTFSDIRNFLTNYYYEQFLEELGQENSALAMEKATAAALSMLPEDDVENSTFGMMLAASVRDSLKKVSGYEDVTFEEIVEYMKSTENATSSSTDNGPANAPRRAIASWFRDIKAAIVSAAEAIGNDCTKAGDEFLGMVGESVAAIGGGAMQLLGGTVEAVKTSVTTGKPLAKTLAENINRTTEFMAEHGQKALNHLYEFSQNTVAGTLITSAVEIVVPGSAPAIASANFVAVGSKMINGEIGLAEGALNLFVCGCEAFGTKAIAAAIKNSAVYKTLAKELSTLIKECGGVLDASKLGKIFNKCLSELGDSKVGKWIGECANDIANLISEHWTGIYSAVSNATGVANSVNGTNNTQQTSGTTENSSISNFGTTFEQVIQNAGDGNSNKTYITSGNIPVTENSQNNDNPQLLVAQQTYLQFGNARIITGIDTKPVYDDSGNIVSYDYTYEYTDNTNYSNTYIPGNSNYQSDYGIDYSNTQNVNQNLFTEEEWDTMSIFLRTSTCTQASYYFQPSDSYSPGVNMALLSNTATDNLNDVASKYTCNVAQDTNGNTVVTETYVNQQGQLVTCTTTLSPDGTVNIHATVNVDDKEITYDSTENNPDLIQQLIDNANQGYGYVMTSSMRSSTGYLGDEQHLQIKSGDETISYDVTDGNCSVSKTVGDVTTVATDPYHSEYGTTTYQDEKGNVHTLTVNAEGTQDTWTDAEGTHEYKTEISNDPETGNTTETKVLTTTDECGNTTVQTEVKVTDNTTGKSVTTISTKTTDELGYSSENRQVRDKDATIERDPDGNILSVNVKSMDENGNTWNTTSYPNGTSHTEITNKDGQLLFNVDTEIAEKNGVWGTKQTYSDAFGHTDTYYPDGTRELTTNMGEGGTATVLYDSNGEIVGYKWVSQDGKRTSKESGYIQQLVNEYNTQLLENAFNGLSGYDGTITMPQLIVKTTGWAPGLYQQYEDAMMHGNYEYADYIEKFNDYYSDMISSGFASGNDKNYWQNNYDIMMGLKDDPTLDKYHSLVERAYAELKASHWQVMPKIDEIPSIDFDNSMDEQQFYRRSDYFDFLRQVAQSMQNSLDEYNRANEVLTDSENSADTPNNAPRRAPANGSQSSDYNATPDLQSQNYMSNGLYSLGTNIGDITMYNSYIGTNAILGKVVDGISLDNDYQNSLGIIGTKITDEATIGSDYEAVLEWNTGFDFDPSIVDYINSHKATLGLTFMQQAAGVNIEEFYVSDDPDYQPDGQLAFLVKGAFEEYYVDVEANTEAKYGDNGVANLQQNKDDLKTMFYQSFKDAKGPNQEQRAEMDKQAQECVDKYIQTRCDYIGNDSFDELERKVIEALGREKIQQDNPQGGTYTAYTYAQAHVDKQLIQDKITYYENEAKRYVQYYQDPNWQVTSTKPKDNGYGTTTYYTTFSNGKETVTVETFYVIDDYQLENVYNDAYSTLENIITKSNVTSIEMLYSPQALDFTVHTDDVLENKMGKFFDFGLQKDLNGNYVVTVNTDYVDEEEENSNNDNGDNNDFVQKHITLEGLPGSGFINRDINFFDIINKDSNDKTKETKETKDINFNSNSFINNTQFTNIKILDNNVLVKPSNETMLLNKQRVELEQKELKITQQQKIDKKLELLKEKQEKEAKEKEEADKILNNILGRAGKDISANKKK